MMSKLTHQWLVVVRFLISGIVPLVLGMAAIGKLLDFSSFSETVNSFRVLSDSLRVTAVIIVPVLELSCLVLLCCGLRFAANLCSLCFLCATTLVVGFEWRANEMPNCACFGLWERFRAVEALSRHMVWRNVALAAIALMSCIIGRRPHGLLHRSPPAGSDGDVVRRGFTLVEMMVTLVIVGVLSTISFVIVQRGSRHAQVGASLANLRTHGQAFSAYNNDHQGLYPHFTLPGFASTTLTGGGVVFNGVSYFEASSTWNIVLCEDYYDSQARADVFRPRWFQRTRPGAAETPYLFACVFQAEPAYWDQYTRIGPVQFGATKNSDVLYTSVKVLIADSHGGHDAWAFAAASVQCDGAAKPFDRSRHISGYPAGDGPQFVNDGAVHFNDSLPLLHTLNGVRGRDYR